MHRQHASKPSGMTDISRWLTIGRTNPWIARAWDPPFDERSFAACDTSSELRDNLAQGNWSLGTAFYLLGTDLCLISQVNGGDEWLTIRHGFAFDSITFGPVIKRGEFDAYLQRLLHATPEQCRSLTW